MPPISIFKRDIESTLVDSTANKLISPIKTASLVPIPLTVIGIYPISVAIGIIAKNIKNEILIPSESPIKYMDR